MKKLLANIIVLIVMFSLSLTALSAAADNTSKIVSVNITSYGAKGDGKTDNTAAFQKLISKYNKKNVEVKIPKGVYVLNKNLTVPSNVTINFSSGSKIKIAKGKKLTINGKVKAGSEQIFTGSGTGFVSAKSTIYPNWWGVKGDNKTDNTNILQKVFSLYGKTTVEITLPKGVYKINKNLTVPSSVTLNFGSGSKISIAKGKKLTIDGKVKAGAEQIFAGTGTGFVSTKSTIYPNWWGAKGDNKTDNTNIFQKVFSLYGKKTVEITLPKGVYNINKNLTVPSNITLKFNSGAKINVAKGKKLAINSNIKAGAIEIFTGTGTVAGAVSASGVYPHWWGAKGDGKSNDTKAIQTAIDSAAALKSNKVVFIPNGTYSVRNLKGKSGITLKGNGIKSILIAHESSKTSESILNCNSVKNVVIKNIVFDGNLSVVKGNRKEGVSCIQINSCTNINISDCTFQHSWYAGIVIQKSQKIYINKNKFIDVGQGIITSGSASKDVQIKNNYFEGSKEKESIVIGSLNNGKYSNIVISDNTIENQTPGNGGILVDPSELGSIILDNNMPLKSYNLKVDYNANGNGTSDNTEEFKKAFSVKDPYYELVIPKGVYRIKNSMTVP